MAKPTSSQGSVRSGATSSTRRTATVRKPRETVKTIDFDFPWSKSNAIYLGLGLATLIVGYLMMSTSVGTDAKWDNSLAITFAPIVLVLAYLVLIPYAIMRSSSDAPDEPTS